ncbi:hypothetical protein MKX03_029181 [Papaver bracteatum]|nr:hypothetical protein MKX03_029181 [Papaver bracteatum]
MFTSDIETDQYKDATTKTVTGIVGKVNEVGVALFRLCSSSSRPSLTGFRVHKICISQVNVQIAYMLAFPGHGGPVSCLTFREGASQLISGSYDRTIKLWNVEDRAYMDTLVGHQGEVLTIDCLQKERVLYVGRDRTMRLFKVAEESQLVFRSPEASLECCCFITFISNDEFVTGSDDGSIKIWNPMRREPAFIVENAHPILPCYDELSTKDNRVSNRNDTAGNGNIKDEGLSSTLRSCVGSVAVCRRSDLIASGAGNGSVNLWGIDGEAKTIRHLHDLPLVGFVNSLAFENSGRFLLAGVGQDPRLGTWGRNSAAPNGVLIHPLKLSEYDSLVLL